MCRAQRLLVFNKTPRLQRAAEKAGVLWLGWNWAIWGNQNHFSKASLKVPSSGVPVILRITLSPRGTISQQSLTIRGYLQVLMLSWQVNWGRVGTWLGLSRATAHRDPGNQEPSTCWLFPLGGKPKYLLLYHCLSVTIHDWLISYPSKLRNYNLRQNQMTEKPHPHYF